MNLPNLPTDNFYKFEFFLGLVIIVYLMFFQKDDKHNAEWEAIRNESNNLQIEANKESLIVRKDLKDLTNYTNEFEVFQKESADFFASIKKGHKPSENEVIYYLERNKYFDEMNKEWQKKSLEYELSSTELTSKAKFLEEKFESLKLEKDDNYNWLYILGGFYFFSGMLIWNLDERKKDKMFDKEYEKVMNERIIYICQSCGMELKYADEILKGKYCNVCYGTHGFKQSEVTFDEFKTMISDRMKEQGFNEKQINKHLKSLMDLDRWKKAFKWS